MRRQSAVELSKISAEQSAAMDDLCNIYSITRSSGTYSTQSTEVRNIRASGVACGIKFSDNTFRLGRTTQSIAGDVLLIDYDVMLRLPASQVISIGDEVQLYEKGQFLVSGTFTLIAAPVVNSTVQRVGLRRTV